MITRKLRSWRLVEQAPCRYFTSLFLMVSSYLICYLPPYLGANVYHKNSGGETGLHFAAYEQDKELITFLWESVGLSMHDPCACSSTPLSIWQKSTGDSAADPSSAIPRHLMLYITSWLSSDDVTSLSLTSMSMQWMLAESFEGGRRENKKQTRQQMIPDSEYVASNTILGYYLARGVGYLATTQYRNAFLSFCEALEQDEYSSRAWYLHVHLFFFFKFLL